MKNIFKTIVFSILSFIFISNVNAGSLSISANKTSVTIGGSVVITVRAPGLAGNFSVTSSHGGVLSGGTSSTWIDDGSQTFTFKANNVGTSTITVTPKDVADYSSGSAYTASKSISITVKAKPVVILSNDNALASLTVDGYTLSPEFNRDNLEYKVELEPETTKINIVANPSHGGASISGSGERDVIDGDNRLEIVVTAENGAQRTYVLNANVKEYDPINVKVNNKNYTVIRKKSSLTAPTNYQETTVKINNNDVPAFKSDITNLTLVGLKDEAGTPNLYVYDNNTYTLYKEYSFNKINLYPLELKDVPNNYKKTTITYNEEKIDVYKITEKSKYALIYGMNLETGEKNIYMYDSKEETLQIYNTEEIEVLNETNNLYLKIIIGLGTLSFVLSIISIVSFIKRNK